MPYRKRSYFSNRQPKPAECLIDWGHPLAQGLVSLTISPSYGVPFEMIQGGKYSTGTVTYTNTKIGSSVGATSGSLIAPVLASGNSNITSGPFSFGCLFDQSGNNIAGGEFPDIFARYTYVSESNNQGFGLGIDGNAGKYRGLVFNNNGSANYALNSNTLVNGSNGQHFLLHTCDRITRTLYFDGKSETTTTNSVTPASNTGTGIGLGGNPANGLKARVYVGYIWKKCLKASEVAWLYREPYAFLYSGVRRIINQVNTTTAATTTNIFNMCLMGVG